MPSDSSPLLPQTNKDAQRKSERKLQNYGAAAQEAGQDVRARAEQAVRHPERAFDDVTPSESTQKKVARFLAAFRAGKLPTQQQVNSWAKTLQESSLLQEGAFERTGALSDEGARVVGDIKEVLEQLQRLGEKKNGDNEIQEFIHATTCAIQEAEVQVSSGQLAPSTSFDAAKHAPSKKEIKRDANQALASIQTIFKLTLSDNAFRDLIADIVNAARDIFADAASEVADKAGEAAERARPSEEERQKRGSSIDFEKVGQRTSETRRDLRRQYETGRLQDKAQETGNQAARWFDERLPTDIQDQAIDRIKNIIHRAQERPEYKESVDTLVQLVRRYARVATKAAQEAGKQAKQAGKEVAENIDDATPDSEEEVDDDIHRALSSGRKVLENFANGKSLDPILDAAKQVFKDVENDERLRNYFSEVGDYIERLLQDTEYVGTQRASRRAEELLNRAKELAEGDAKWKKDADLLVREVQAFGRALQEDEGTADLIEAITDLAEDLQVFGGQALDIFSSELSSIKGDLLNVILPRVISLVKEIELPRVEFKSADFDVVIDSVKIAGLDGSLIPQKVLLNNFNELLLEQGYAAFAANARSTMRLSVDGLDLAIKDAAYYVNKKTGYTHEDYGLMSLTAKNFNFFVELETAQPKDRQSFFKVKSVDVDTTGFNIKVHKTHRPITNFFVMPFIRNSFLRPQLGNLIAESIEKQINELDQSLFAAHQRAIAVAQYSATQGGVPSILGYARAFVSDGIVPGLGGSKAGAGKVGKTAGITKRGQHGEWILCVGVQQHILPGKGGPAGFYEEQAQRTAEAAKDFGNKAKLQGRQLTRELRRAQREERKKEGWKSDAFDLGPSV